MKKGKSILAAVAAVLLPGMYISLLVFALMDKPGSENMLMAALAITIILPVLLYGFTLVYRITKQDEDDGDK